REDRADDDADDPARGGLEKALSEPRRDGVGAEEKAGDEAPNRQEEEEEPQAVKADDRAENDENEPDDHFVHAALRSFAHRAPTTPRRRRFRSPAPHFPPGEPKCMLARGCPYRSKAGATSKDGAGANLRRLSARPGYVAGRGRP